MSQRSFDEDNDSIHSFEPKVTDTRMPPMTKTNTSGSSFRVDQENVYINEVPIPRQDFQDFIYASGGALQSGYRPAPQRTFGNPVPAALFCFGIACFVLGLIDAGAGNVSNPSVLVGTCFFSSGLTLFICAIWCLIIENTWAATVLFGFGAFWASYACLLWDNFGIASSYSDPQEYANAVGILFSSYVVFSFLLWICTFKSTIPMFILFFLVWFFILLLDIGVFTGNAKVTQAGGAFAFITGLSLFYNAFAGMADTSNSYFVITPWFMPGAAKPAKAQDEENKQD